MNVELKGVLREIAGTNTADIIIEQHISIAELKRKLGIEAGIPVVASLDGRQLPADHLFRNSDSIILMPVVAGG